MNLFFIAWGQYAGFKASVDCAIARAGVPVHVIDDKNIHEFDGVLYDLLPNGKETDGSVFARTASLARWFVLREIIRTLGIAYPVFCADWDMMIFSDLNKACAPFLGNDFARTVNHPNLGDTNAAYLICNPDALSTFCEIACYRTSSTENPEYHDMAVWRQVANQGKWKVGDLTEIIDGSTFDLGIHCSLGKYRMNGKSKLVTWRDDHPYFTIDATGEQILAHNIHCWGEYKGREPELLKLAGI